MSRWGRKKNEPENGDLITKAAFELLMEKGYADTSYADIAKRSGKTRSLVQYYYPKKEALLSEFMLRSLELSGDYMEEHALGTDSCFIDFAVMGHMHFHFLLANEDLRPLALDITSQRPASQAVIEVMHRWGCEYEELKDLPRQTTLDAYLLSLGGAYELTSQHLRAETPIDIPDLLKRTITTFMFQLGFPTEDFEAEFETHLLSDEVIDDANEYILEHIREPV